MSHNKNVPTFSHAMGVHVENRLKEQMMDLRCCGNCIWQKFAEDNLATRPYTYLYFCQRPGDSLPPYVKTKPNHHCQEWRRDNMKSKDREASLKERMK